MPLRSPRIACLLLPFALWSLLPSAAEAGEGVLVGNPPAVVRDPVLMWEVEGGEFVGHFIHLSVYADGVTSLATGPGIYGNAGARTESRWVGRETVRLLQRELIQAGALRIEIPGSWCVDAPTTSVTVFRPARKGRVSKRPPGRPGRAWAHSYAYRCITGPHAQAATEVREIIWDFIDQSFLAN